MMLSRRLFQMPFVGSTLKIRTMQGKVISTENCAARSWPEMDRGTVRRSPAEAHGVYCPVQHHTWAAHLLTPAHADI